MPTQSEDWKWYTWLYDVFPDGLFCKHEQLNVVKICIQDIALPVHFGNISFPIQSYETRYRKNYRYGRHITIVHKRLASQTRVQFNKRLLNSIKSAPIPKVFKTHFKTLIAEALYSTDVFFSKPLEKRVDWKWDQSGEN